ncbi:hypothetical protein CPC08DRAFT_819951 [Agrocybe pediades]|nr:hypothetical protein CPC08DRAFT_819951 [Agrocybe pediades]
MAASPRARRKILVLHGYGQNAYIISRRISLLMSECDDDDLDFYYIDGPLILRPAQFPSRKLEDIMPITNNTSEEELQCNLTRSPAPSSTPRGWWQISHVVKSPTPGLERSLQLLKTVFKENRFEAIIGFSQGSAMADYIASMLEGHYPHPAFCDNGRLVHPPLKYVILNAGFLLRGPYIDWTKTTPQAFELDYDVTPMLDTPVLHVIGKHDAVVVPERTGLLMKFSRNKRVLEHAGGHFINIQPRWRKFYAMFFRDPLGQFALPLQSLSYQTNFRVNSSNNDSNIMDTAGRLSTISERGSSAGSSTPDSVSAPQTPKIEDGELPEDLKRSDLSRKSRSNSGDILYYEGANV